VLRLIDKLWEASTTRIVRPARPHCGRGHQVAPADRWTVVGFRSRLPGCPGLSGVCGDAWRANSRLATLAPDTGAEEVRGLQPLSTDVMTICSEDRRCSCANQRDSSRPSTEHRIAITRSTRPQPLVFYRG
jgi:hypothetical protein